MWKYECVTRQEFELIKDKIEKMIVMLGGNKVPVDLPYTQRTVFEYNDGLYSEIVNNPQRYMQLPDARDIDHFKVMEGFVENRVLDVKQKKQLAKVIKSIKRTHIFGEFDGEVNAQGLLEEWHKYLDEEYEKYAETWCAERGIIII